MDEDVIKSQKREGEKHRQKATQQFLKAQELAALRGFSLTKCGTIQYVLKGGDWAVSIYPGNQKIYQRGAVKVKTSKLPSPWGLFDVVESIVEPKLVYNRFLPNTIKELAYHLWERAGRPVCDGNEFWFEAERMINGFSEREIEVTAHHLWEAAGKPEGTGDDFWYKATEMLKSKQ